MMLSNNFDMKGLGVLIEIYLHTKIRNFRFRTRCARFSILSAVAMAMRVVILWEGLAMEAFVRFLSLIHI